MEHPGAQIDRPLSSHLEVLNHPPRRLVVGSVASWPLVEDCLHSHLAVAAAQDHLEVLVELGLGFRQAMGLDFQVAVLALDFRQAVDLGFRVVVLAQDQ